MVTGLDKFREAFLEYADNYVIIGGTACDIVLRDTDMKPRATSDIDMIVVVENMTPEFAAAFWQFIRDGRYKPPGGTGRQMVRRSTPFTVLRKLKQAIP